MKVTLHQPAQFYKVNNRTNISISANNPHSKINLQSRDTVAFGNYLDDEKSDLEDDLDEIKKSVKSAKKEIDWENSYHYDETLKLDAEIKTLNSEVIITANEIATLKNETMEQDARIKQAKESGQNLEKDVKSGKEIVNQLQSTHKEVLQGISTDAKIAAKLRETTLGQQSEHVQKIYEQEMKNAIAGIKNKLIQNIINPTIQESEGDNIRVPSSLLIESNSDDVAKKVFGWITKKTGSNYAILDAQECENKSGLMSLLTYVSEKAKKDFDASRVRTFTLIENFDSFVHAQNEVNDKTYKFFKEFLSKCSELYNTTIVAVTKSGSKINETNGPSFNIKLNLDSVFMQDKRLGYDSILNELIELKTLGKNHLFSAFEGLRKV